MPDSNFGAQKIIQSLKELTCSLCELPGHARPQCWFNGAFYEECRRQGELEMNYTVRGAIKLKAKTDALQLRYEK